MNRTELVDSVAEETGLEKKQADAAITAALNKVVAEIKSGSRVTIFGFGTFNPKSNPARMGRNPQTNQPMKVSASKGVGFKPATAFKEALNSKKAAKKTVAAKKATTAKKSAPKKTAPAKTAAKKTVAKKATAAKKR